MLWNDTPVRPVSDGVRRARGSVVETCVGESHAHAIYDGLEGDAEDDPEVGSCVARRAGEGARVST